MPERSVSRAGTPHPTRRDEVVDVAEQVLEQDGVDAVTMRRLAAELGIRAPSLYKHVRDKAEIEAALQERALRQLAESLAPCADDLRALAAAYRRWALGHPGLYALSAEHVLHRDRLSAGTEDAAAAPLVRVVAGDIDRARALWGFAHGLVSLELAGRFPADADIDAAWASGLEAFGVPRQDSGPTTT